MTMINVNEAIERSQKVNRDNWLNEASERLSKAIIEKACTGCRELSVCLHQLIIGAENLYEAAEMLAYLYKDLNDSGYKHEITPNGDLIINW